MEQVYPTRTELLTRQAQIRLAEQGANLLRSKREALVREFLRELRSFAKARKAMQRATLEAIESLMDALAMDGDEAVRSAALVCDKSYSLEAKTLNFWGTRLVEVESGYTAGDLGQRGYTPLGTTARIDETADRFESAVDLILKIAPVDLKLRVLAEDISKTSRRVNALEQRLLPKLTQQVRFIRSALDQREREDIFRLKMLKRRGAASH